MSTQFLSTTPSSQRPLTQGWSSLWRGNHPLAYTVVVSLALVAVAAAGLVLDPRTITGAPAWMKPLKFAISTAVYSGTLAWMLTFVQGRRRVVAVAGATVAVSFIGELAIILVQMLRGTTSHFNLRSEEHTSELQS